MNILQIIGMVMLYIVGCPVMTVILDKLFKVLNDEITWKFGGKTIDIYIYDKVLMKLISIAVIITWPISYTILIIRAIVMYFIERKRYLKRIKEEEERKEFMKQLEKEWMSV